MSLQNRLKRFFILSLLGLTIGAAIAGVSVFLDQSSAGQKTIPLAAPSLGGPFSLINQNGQTVTEKDFIGQKYMLIYFGFASCPAICPTELQKMTDAYRALPTKLQQRIQPIFITIDPERDTAEILKDYVALFMPELIGLTGSVEQIDAAKKAYKIYAAKVPEGDSYTMDHSSFIYLMDRNGKALALFKTQDKATAMAEQISQLVQAN